jgi:hypothetical protein
VRMCVDHYLYLIWAGRDGRGHQLTTTWGGLKRGGGHGDVCTKIYGSGCLRKVPVGALVADRSAASQQKPYLCRYATVPERSDRRASLGLRVCQSLVTLFPVGFRGRGAELLHLEIN